MPIALSCRAAAGPWRAYLRARARQVLAALGLKGYELSLSLVADDEMRGLNRAYRGHDRTTNVLAFPLHTGTAVATLQRRQNEGAALRRTRRDHRAGSPARRATGCGRAAAPDGEPGPGSRLLGDVVISLDSAAAEARALRTSLASHLDALLIHGVLHLIGYDHEISAAEERRMTRRAREVRAVLRAARSPLAPSAGPQWPRQTSGQRGVAGAADRKRPPSRQSTAPRDSGGRLQRRGRPAVR